MPDLADKLAEEVIDLIVSMGAIRVSAAMTRHGDIIEPIGCVFVWSANVQEQIAEHFRRLMEDHHAQAR